MPTRFNTTDNKRIAAAVRKIENLPQSTVGTETFFPRYTGGFWAKLGAEKDGKYSWGLILADKKKLDTSYTYAKAANDDDNGYAVEIYGSKNCLKDDVVFLYPALNGDYYIFDYNPGLRLGYTTKVIGRLSNEKVKIRNEPSDIEIMAYNPFEAINKDKSIALDYYKAGKTWVIVSAECN